MKRAKTQGGIRPYVVVLTGGVAAGKSAAARCFESHGVHVYDADVAAREVVVPGKTAIAEIESVFGAEVLNADGTLDRRAMRERVFADPVARKKLEGIIHPRVRAWLRQRIDNDPGPYCILAIPLLAENRSEYGWVDRVLLIDAPEALQIERLMRRDGVTREAAQRLLDAQSTRGQRLAIADDVIVNDGDESALDARIAALHARYLEFARADRTA